ncbi:MAG: cbb3-type cytochrome c oxidase subunit II [Thermoleophilia bacterium]
MANGKKWLPLYRPYPKEWAPHPVKKMLMTPMLVVVGGLFAFALPSFFAAFMQMVYFKPPVSNEWAPLTAAAERGRNVFVSNGCVYCHSGFTRPQDVESGLYYLYPTVSKPGDFATSDSSPNIFGTARIGPDLSQEGGFHPDDWERAHLNNPRYVDPDSIMPQFSFLSDQEVEDLNIFLETRSGKSGLIRYAGQIYMKRVLLAANNMPEPPQGYTAEKLTLKDVAMRNNLNPPTPPGGNYDGLGWPDPINLNIVDRTFWLAGNPLPVTTDNLLRGREIFQERCIGCHGQGGAAVSEAARYLSPPPIDFTSPEDASGGNDTSPGDYYYRILRGIRGSGMENFGTRLSVDDIWRVVLFLKTIPNGGLQKLPTPDMYIQWQPPQPLHDYVQKHPIEANKQFQNQGGPEDPFLLEAGHVLAGLNNSESFMLPGYGEISLEAAARDIKAIYDQFLNEGWNDFQKRDGEPTPPPEQKSAPTELKDGLR